MYEIEVESEREFCNCGNLMACKASSSHRQHDEASGFYYTIEIFKLFICLACDSATLILYSTFGNADLDEDDRNDPTAQHFRYSYKRTVLYAPRKRHHLAIPKSIAEVADQAESVLYKSPRASFILCRAVLEEICNAFEIPTEKANSKGFIGLKDRLTQLFQQEGMSEDLQAIINGVKDLGDKGTHRDHLTFSGQVEIQEAENLLMLMRYVLERIFVDRYRQQEAEKVLEKLKAKILLSSE